MNQHHYHRRRPNERPRHGQTLREPAQWLHLLFGAITRSVIAPNNVRAAVHALEDAARYGYECDVDYAMRNTLYMLQCLCSGCLSSANVDALHEHALLFAVRGNNLAVTLHMMRAPYNLQPHAQQRVLSLLERTHMHGPADDSNNDGYDGAVCDTWPCKDLVDLFRDSVPPPPPSPLLQLCITAAE